MKMLTLGVRGPTGYLRADSQPLSDEDAASQYQEAAARIGDKGLLTLPWITVSGADIILARLTRLA